MTGRNNASGAAGGGTFRVFATRPAALDPGKVVDAVVLPEGSNQGVLHIFDVALAVRR